MEDSEQPKELCLQILVALSLNIFAVEPNFLAESSAPKFDFLIVSLFLKFLGMIKVFLANNYQVSEFHW